MKPVFLDTVGLLALWDKSDQWHDVAQKAFELLVDAKATLTTTSFILLECGNAAARRPYRKIVDTLRDQLESAGLLVEPTKAEWYEAWETYRAGDADSAGIVDQVSFHVMRRLDMTDERKGDVLIYPPLPRLSAAGLVGAASIPSPVASPSASPNSNRHMGCRGSRSDAMLPPPTASRLR